MRYLKTYEEIENFQGFNVGDLIVSNVDTFVITKIISRTLIVFHFMNSEVENINFLNFNGYNFLISEDR